jgi:hypothetical protein
MSGHDHDHHGHHHHHDHDHSELSETELRVRALESVLTEKGYVDPAALDLLGSVPNHCHVILLSAYFDSGTRDAWWPVLVER